MNLPWTLRFDAESGTSVYLSAQKGSEFGRVEAKIYVDGNLLQEASSSSPSAIASVGGVARSSEISFSRMTSAKHIERARLALESGLTREAARHVDSISQTEQGAPQYKELYDVFRKHLKDETDEWSLNSSLQILEESLKKRDRLATASALEQQVVLSADFLKDVSEQRRRLDMIRKSSDMDAFFCKLGFREVRFTGTGTAGVAGDLILPSGGRIYSLECE